MVNLGSLEIMEVLSHATNTIAEGEVMQLANIGNCALSELSTARSFAAKLFYCSKPPAILGRYWRVNKSL